MDEHGLRIELVGGLDRHCVSLLRVEPPVAVSERHFWLLEVLEHASEDRVACVELSVPAEWQCVDNAVGTLERPPRSPLRGQNAINHSAVVAVRGGPERWDKGERA